MRFYTALHQLLKRQKHFQETDSNAINCQYLYIQREFFATFKVTETFSRARVKLFFLTFSLVFPIFEEKEKLLEYHQVQREFFKFQKRNYANVILHCSNFLIDMAIVSTSEQGGGNAIFFLSECNFFQECESNCSF